MTNTTHNNSPIFKPADFIGIPFAELNCGELLEQVFEQVHGVNIGVKRFDVSCASIRETAGEVDRQTKTISADSRWMEIGDSEAFCVVAFERAGLVFHVGFVIDDAGNVLHTAPETGARIDKVFDFCETYSFKPRFYKWR